MNQTIAASEDLPTQENAIRNWEANGYELIGLVPDLTAPPNNTGAFNRLPIGALPKRLHLTDGTLPAGKKAFWTGTIHVSGSLQPALAYRD